MMPYPLKVTNEQIINTYKKTGSVWRAAKELGICGQSVWERLKILGYVMPCTTWTEEEVIELTALAPQCTIGEIARRLGRPYAGVAGKISQLQLGVRYGNQRKSDIKRGSGLTKTVVLSLVKDLSKWSGSIRQFCQQRGLDIEVLIKAIQRYSPEFWVEYTKAHSDMKKKICPQCKSEYYPMNARQLTCSRICAGRNRSDRKYFGGKRTFAVGMEEGVCQLCERDKKSLLAAHHVYGKENDQENEYLIALCNGCHNLVTRLGVRTDVSSPEFWENLISLAVTRKHGARKPVGFHVCVDIEELTEEDLEAELDQTA